jgi:hypothetical protein
MRPSIVKSLIVVSREHDANKKGLSGCNVIPYTSALWSVIVKIQFPFLMSQIFIVESQEPDNKHHEISGTKHSALTLLS